MTTAQVEATLREIGNDLAEDISELRQREFNEELRQRVLACDRGAACVALVAQLAQIDEKRMLLSHEDVVRLWQQATDLWKG